MCLFSLFLKGIMNNLRLFFVLLILAFGSIAGTLRAQSIHSASLHQGDLIFVTAKSTGWSAAINEVTASAEKTAQYAHVGIVMRVNEDKIMLMHAAPNPGVEIIDLQDFTQDTTNHYDVFRLRNQHQIHWDTAFETAKKWLGAPYNFTYIMNDSSFYCSELVYRILEAYSIFELEPMTFQVEGQTHDFWIQYYQDLGVAIPEGLPGCNPNGLASDDDLFFVGRLYLPKNKP